MSREKMKESVDLLQTQIKFWEDKLKQSRSNVDCALLQDKITNAKNKIKEMQNEKPEKIMKTQIDAPSLADKSENLERGQVRLVETSSSEAYVSI